jgi:HTH-type transcriptional regulator/antitoxin HigA
MKGTDRIHPGELLLEEILERGFIPSDFATRHRIDPDRVLALCKSEVPITPELARQLSLSLGTSVGLWMNLQEAYDKGRMPGEIGL